MNACQECLWQTEGALEMSPEAYGISPMCQMLWLHVWFFTTCVKCLAIIVIMSGSIMRNHLEYKQLISTSANDIRNAIKDFVNS